MIPVATAPESSKRVNMDPTFDRVRWGAGWETGNRHEYHAGTGQKRRADHHPEPA
jgi:hypothetical protein